MKIKDILTIDLGEDIKNVIDLEDISEKEIKAEIESYIVTDGLAKDYADFVSVYTSNIVETGVWISGFYGSGKSYFGKLLGYMINNRLIMGTPARDRILQRFGGIQDEALVRNALSRLETSPSRVIFLDIAKQDTSKGFAFALFRNFLRSLELPENEHGCFLYQLMMNEKQTNIHDFIFSHLNKDWSTIKTRLVEYAKAAKTIYMEQGNSESDYTNLITTIRRDIDQFSASRLKEELTNFIQVQPDEKIVFLFDEASEAINQKKLGLLDLEGVSESLSSLGGKVWTVAIAQEKLDDVINNSNVNKAQLTKVTDRFKTKIHLEATEVDVIIQNRLLKKTNAGIKKLNDHFQQHSGKITDHSSIIGTGITKTNSVDSYTTYYPFYKYQFDLLQNFLFGTKGYASTKVAARGMIITTYDILKKEVQHADLFNTVTGWQISKEGQPQPPVRLVNRYDNAEKILKEIGSSISGRKLLESINFLTEAEITPCTLPNIIKSYTSEPEAYHKVQDEISKALDILTDTKILLETNKTYRITSDIEQRLLDEMNGFTVQGFVKKKQLISAYKASPFTKTISKISDSAQQYDLYITTDTDDELTNPAQKYLKLRIKSLYNLSDDRSSDIDTVKVQHQNDKDLIWAIPDDTHFTELDKLIDEVERISYLEERHKDPNSEEYKTLSGFKVAKGEKQSRITDLVEDALVNGSVVYLYNTFQLSKDNWQPTLTAQLKLMVQNVYSKRLSSQLNDTVATAIIKEANNERLKQYFPGNDFAFFDAKGNFIGENLKITEEILYKIRNTFVDGATLEKELQQPPAGFTFGTVISSVAALMRAGKVIAKFNGAEKFSWRDEGVAAIFNVATQFRKATFKAVSKSMNIQQRQDLAQFLLDIEADSLLNRKIDFNTNDFELVNAVRDTARHFADKVTTLRNADKDFDTLFPTAESQKDFLGQFTGAVSEANYIDKAVEFFALKDPFLKATQDIEKVEKFIRNYLPKVKEWRVFVSAVKDELSKTATSNDTISKLVEEFDVHYTGDVVHHFASLQQTAQKIKDEYHRIFSDAMKDCAFRYAELSILTKALKDEIAKLPTGLNVSAEVKVNSLVQYAYQRSQPTISLDYDVKDKQSRFTYSEVLSFIDLYNSKKTEADIIRAGLIREKKPEPVSGSSAQPIIQTYSAKLPAKKMKVAIYKQWLQQELQKLAGASDNDEVEIKD